MATLALAAAAAVGGVVWMSSHGSTHPTRYVTSSINGKSYRVLDRQDGAEAADALATLESKIGDLLDAADDIVPGDPRFANIRDRWSGTLHEIDGSDNIAYSVDKSDVYICVRAKDGSVDTELNDSMFVLLHELSHVANRTYGHGTDFWKTFKFVLEVSEKSGVYTFRDYDRSSVEVCGRVINTTPLSCVKNGECFSELSGERVGSGIGALRPTS